MTLDRTYFWIWNGLNGCAGARAVKEEMGLQAIRHQGSTFQGARDKVVINWGSSNPSAEVLRCTIINRPEAVARSVNKIRFFETVNPHTDRETVRTVPWTTNRLNANAWLQSGSKVVCRTRLEGREGEGIVIVAPPSPSEAPPAAVKGLVARVRARIANARPASNLGLPEACRLFTKFVPDTVEYRIHVIGGRVVAAHRKGGGTDESVRNTANGWLFSRVRHPPRDVATQALATVAALGLDFAAVDVLFCTNDDRAYVLETNTAPGIDGMEWTVRQYAEGLTRVVNALRAV